jgi:hypothetical protein
LFRKVNNLEFVGMTIVAAANALQGSAVARFDGQEEIASTPAKHVHVPAADSWGFCNFY